MTKRKLLAKIIFWVSGLALLYESAFGLIAILGIGVNSWQDIVTDFCLVSAFPIYLLAFGSDRLANVGLWTFFGVQWLDMCLISKPIQLVNPFDWPHGDVLFFGILLFTISYKLRNQATV